jgi:hypothetical protein
VLCGNDGVDGRENALERLSFLGGLLQLDP